MGLACSNIRLLTLTARKADCEYGISIDSMRKMALSREQSNFSKNTTASYKQKALLIMIMVSITRLIIVT